MAGRVVSLCVYIAEGVTAWQYFSHQFPLKRRSGQAGLGLAAAYGIAWALFAPYRMWSNTLLFTLANLLSLCVFFACSWKASIFHSVLLTCLMVASEFAVTKKYKGQFQQYYDEKERLFHTLILFPENMEP